MPHHGVWVGFFFGFFPSCVCVAESLAGFISADRLLSFIYMVPSQRKSLAKAQSWEGHGRVTIVAQRHSCEPVSVSSEFAMIPFSAIARLWTLVFSASTTTGNTGNSAPTAAPTAALADNGNQTSVLAPPNQTQQVTSISIVV